MASPRSREGALEELGRELGALSVRLQAEATETALRFHADLPPAAFHVARWLDAFGPARVGDVAEGVSMDRTAVSRLVRNLQGVGFAELRPDPADGRAQLVQLTRTGRRQLTRAVNWKASSYYERLEGWNRDDMTTLAALLRRLNGSPH